MIAGTNNARGFDHAFVIHGEPGTLRLAARVEQPCSAFRSLAKQ